MKRTLAITLTVAMVGGLMFMGFAGTATAQETLVNVGDIDFGDQTSGDATATSNVDVDQSNSNAQVGVADSDADSEAVAVGSGDTKDGGSADAFSAAGAASIVDQTQDVDQTNAAEVDSTSVAESGDNEQEVDIESTVLALLDGLGDDTDGDDTDGDGTDGDGTDGIDG